MPKDCLVNQNLYNQTDNLADVSTMTGEQITLELIAYGFTEDKLRQSEQEIKKFINEFLGREKYKKSIKNPVAVKK